jgi:hypothetical protein
MEQMRKRLAPAFSNSADDVTIIGAGTSHLDPRQAGSFISLTHRYSDVEEEKNMYQCSLTAIAGEQRLPFEAGLL